jgi:drug/metabolite transporter (DMT)-like permease
MSQMMAPRQAAVFVLAGMATLGLTDNFVAIVSDASSLWQFHLVRGVMVLGGMGIMAALGFGVILPNRLLPALARSVFLSASMLIYFGCVAILPIGVVVAGLFTSPLFVALIASYVQGKPIGTLHKGAIALGFLGALMVIRPDPGHLELVAFLPVLAGLLYAIGAVATRAWCEGEPTLALGAVFFAVLSLMGAVGCLILPATGQGAAGFATRGWMPLDAGLVFWLAVQAMGGLVGMLCLFRGYQIGEASRVAVFEYSLLIFASGWAWYLWGQVVPPLGLAGMALIVASGAVIALRSTVSE